MSTESMAVMSERLRSARQQAGHRSARAAALRLGIAPSTYSAHENGQNDFGPDAARLYARAFGVSAAWLLTGDTGTAQHARDINATQKGIPIKGDAAAGIWFEGNPLDNTGSPAERVPFALDSQSIEGAVYALRMRGNSFERTAPDGALLICVETEKRLRDLPSGTMAVVERHRKNADLTEISVRRVEHAGDRTELYADSTDPRWSNPVVATGDTSNDAVTVTIRGIVLWILRAP